MMPRQRCPFCQNTPRLEVERGLKAEVGRLQRQVTELQVEIAHLKADSRSSSPPSSGAAGAGEAKKPCGGVYYVDLAGSMHRCECPQERGHHGLCDPRLRSPTSTSTVAPAEPAKEGK